MGRISVRMCGSSKNNGLATGETARDFQSSASAPGAGGAKAARPTSVNAAAEHAAAEQKARPAFQFKSFCSVDVTVLFIAGALNRRGHRPAFQKLPLSAPR